MNIVHINLAGGLGGGEFQTVALIETLAERGLNQRLLLRPGKPLETLARARGIHTASANRALCAPRANCWQSDTLIHAHDGRGVHWAALAGQLRGLPYMITRRLLKAPSNGRWTRRAYRRASGLSAVSQAAASALQAWQPGLNCTVIPDALLNFRADEQQAQQLRDTAGGAPIVVQAGRLSAEKGVEITLDVARQFAAAGHPAIFWIVGDGPLREPLAQAAVGLDNVRFWGHREDIGDFLLAADVLLHPAHSEAFGSVILEALQQRTAVIAARVGGIPEAVQGGRAGLLVEAGDAAAFAAALRGLLDDVARRDALLEAGTQCVANYALPHIAAGYLSLYQECLNSHRAGRRSRA